MWRDRGIESGETEGGGNEESRRGRGMKRDDLKWQCHEIFWPILSLTLRGVKQFLLSNISISR